MSKFIAVLDIGKTNKKTVIFDENLKQVHSEYKNFPGREIDGLQTEDAEEAFNWFVGELAKLSKKYDIGAISVTTHGATFACTDKDFNLTIPVISYTNDPGEGFHKNFFAKYGDADKLHREVGTANMGGLANFGKGVEFVKTRFPDKFSKTVHIVNYPQYFGYMLTGKAAAEYTYAGNHSYLFNFKKKGWSRIADEMEIKDKLPKSIGKPHAVLGTITDEIAKKTGLSRDTIVTHGIHDSNASYLPYLIKEKGKFILNSTGTWFVIMAGAKEASFSDQEIKAAVFCNANVYGDPVKTAVFMAGGELDLYRGLLKKYFNCDKHFDLNEKVYAKILSENSAFILPGFLPGTGPFPDSTSRIIYEGKTYHVAELDSKEKFPAFFNDPEYAYAAITLSLAIQTTSMLQNVELSKGTRVFVEGGFRNNHAYCALLAALSPDADVVLSDMSEATSFGSAIIAKSAMKGIPLEEIANDIIIRTEPVKKHNFKGLEEYRRKFLELLDYN